MNPCPACGHPQWAHRPKTLPVDPGQPLGPVRCEDCWRKGQTCTGENNAT